MGGGSEVASSKLNIENATTNDSQPMVYQFQIVLRYTKPKIWRQIHVPGYYTFEDLHEAIQDCMEWNGMHPHKFQIKNPKTNQTETLRPESANRELLLDDETVSEEDAKIADYFVSSGNKALYTYDFGDRWEHKVILEKIFPAISGAKYPKCIAGKRACPPDDCGGVCGYYNLLRSFKNASDSDHEDSLEWFDDDFDPDHFDPNSVWNEDN